MTSHVKENKIIQTKTNGPSHPRPSMAFVWLSLRAPDLSRRLHRPPHAQTHTHTHTHSTDTQPLGGSKTHTHTLFYCESISGGRRSCPGRMALCKSCAVNLKQNSSLAASGKPSFRTDLRAGYFCLTLSESTAEPDGTGQGGADRTGGGGAEPRW